MAEENQRVKVNWVQVCAGALAAMSSAVLLSTVGAAGTIIGAALGSVVVTVGKELYSSGIRASRQAATAAQAAASRRVARARTQVGRAVDELDGDTLVDDTSGLDAERQLRQARGELDAAENALDTADAPPRTSLKETLAGLPWKRIALAAAGVFLVAMLAITAFELLSGRSVSSYTGGSSDGRTSITGLGGSSHHGQGPAPASPSTTPTSSNGGTASSSPSARPNTRSTPGATPSGTPTPTAPSPTPSPTPTHMSTPSPSAAATPTATRTPARASAPTTPTP